MTVAGPHNFYVTDLAGGGYLAHNKGNEGN